MAIFSLGVVQLNIKVIHTSNVSDNYTFFFFTVNKLNAYIYCIWKLNTFLDSVNLIKRK